MQMIVVNKPQIVRNSYMVFFSNRYRMFDFRHVCNLISGMTSDKLAYSGKLYLVYDYSACYFKKYVRHGPFDIRGGGGLEFFSKKISLLWFWLKENIAQWHSEKNNLSPTV